MEQLGDWIEFFLGIRLPDCTVDPDSNSNPLHFAWSVYSKAKEGDDEEFQRVLAYACRGGGKTLVAAIIEVLCLFHLGRNVGIGSAILDQARVMAGYLKGFANRPHLRDFIVGENEREVKVAWYESGDKRLSTAEWEALSPEDQSRYTFKSGFLKVVVATVTGMNSLHVPFLCLDEVDLADPAAIAESVYIPTQGLNGELPITLLTSTRKFAVGNVQKEIDNADETKLQIFHWNVIDITQPCPPSRHKPDEPKVHLWIEPGDPKRIVQDADAQLLDESERSKLVRLEGFAGCAKCPLFAACKGNLATKQTATGPILKPISSVIGELRASSAEKAAAQMLCWKPSREGMIWSRLSRERHMKTPAQMAELITGEKYPESFTKADLINLFTSMGMPAIAGLDWGFTHLWTVVLGFLDGQKLYIVECIGAAELELSEKLEICDRRIKHLSPTIYPDQAYPADNKTFRKNGYRMMKFKKDVAGGIEAVRLRLEPGADKEPNLFFLSGDEGVETMFKSISGYHYKIDAAGNATEIPDDEDDDWADALKYLCQNLLTNKKPIVSSDVGEVNDTPPLLDVNAPGIYTQDNFLAKKIEELTQHTPSGTITGMSKGKRGGFFFSG